MNDSKQSWSVLFDSREQYRRTGTLVQTTFAALVLVLSMPLLFLVPNDFRNVPYALGVTVLVAATVMPFLPWRAGVTQEAALYVVPTLDFAAIILMRWAAPDIGTTPLILLLVIPIVWLGTLRSYRGVILTGALAAALVVPNIVVAMNSDDPRRVGPALMLVLTFPIFAVLTAFLSHRLTTIAGHSRESLQKEQARLTAALEADEISRRLLDSVLNTVDVGIIVLGAHGERLLMNRPLRDADMIASAGVDPWTALATVAQFHADKVTPYDADDTPYARAARGEKLDNEVIWVGAPDTSRLAVSLSSETVTAPNGAVYANVIASTDVTAYMLALEARDAFVGTVSHELRTPLTSIAGYLELVQDEADSLPAEVNGYLEVISRNVQRQILLVNELLTTARARTAPILLHRSACDLTAIAHEAVATYRGEASRQNLTITVTGEPTPCTLDPRLTAEVVENLVSNAVRYTPAGGSITVHTEAVQASAARPRSVRLTVTDTGIGISEADLGHLFDDFFRADSARAAAIRGVGLGLGIAKAIVTAHQGSITVASTLGEGTTFTVELPAD